MPETEHQKTMRMLSEEIERLSSIRPLIETSPKAPVYCLIDALAMVRIGYIEEALQCCADAMAEFGKSSEVSTIVQISYVMIHIPYVQPKNSA